MTAKALVQQLLDSLPDDSSLDQIVRELAMLRMMERGAEDSDAGRVISHEEMKKRAESWRNSGGPPKRKTG